jgi:hypothetical protein
MKMRFAITDGMRNIGIGNTEEEALDDAAESYEDPETGKQGTTVEKIEDLLQRRDLVWTLI